MNMIFCHQCMRKRPKDEQICPICGYVHGAPNVVGYVLPPETILDGRYLLGNMQKQDHDCISYSALDLQSENAVRIVEYFPRKKASRSGTAVLWSVPIEDAQNLLIGFQKQNSNTDLFLENGTIYSVQSFHSEQSVAEIAPPSAALTVPDKKAFVEVSDQLIDSPSAGHASKKKTAGKSGNSTGAKKRTKHSQGRKALATIAVILLLLLGWCGGNHLRGNQAMEQKDYVKAISAYRADFLFGKMLRTEALRLAGEECFENEDYAAAAEYFSQMGSAGEARWSDAIYEQAMLLIRDQKYQDAITVLEKIASEDRAAEQKGLAQLKIAEELYRSGKTDEAIAQAKSIENTTYADVIAFLNNVYLNEAKIYINRKEYDKAIEEYKKCQGNAEAEFYLSVFDDLYGEDPYSAATAIIEQQDKKISSYSKSDWLLIFRRIIQTLPTKKNLEARLNQKAAIRLLENPIDFFSESYSQEFDTIFNDIDMIDCTAIPQDENITVRSLEELYKNCGTNPAGKILIVVQTHDFPDKNATAMISFGAMELLPAEYHPASLAEVEHVVLIDYNYSRSGSYTKGTKAVRENAKITIYHMPDLKAIASSNTLQGGYAPGSFYYYGSPPAWKSGGAPNVSAKLVEMLKKIM